MTISKHIQSLREHLASLGLQSVPDVNAGDQNEVFKICFLNKLEMQRWKALQEQQKTETNHNILHGSKDQIR